MKPKEKEMEYVNKNRGEEGVGEVWNIQSAIQNTLYARVTFMLL
jgi:hypothetical protein